MRSVRWGGVRLCMMGTLPPMTGRDKLRKVMAGLGWAGQDRASVCLSIHFDGRHEQPPQQASLPTSEPRLPPPSKSLRWEGRTGVALRRRYAHGGQTGAKRAGWHGDFRSASQREGSLARLAGSSRSQSLLNQDRHGMRTPLTGAFRLPYPPALPACLPHACACACLIVSWPPPALLSAHLARYCQTETGTEPARPAWVFWLWLVLVWSGLVWCLGYTRCRAMRCDRTGWPSP